MKPVKAKDSPSLPSGIKVYVPTPKTSYGSGGKCNGMNEAPKGNSGGSGRKGY